MKYLVTGGAGFIGSALTRRLVSEGHEVRVLDNMTRGTSGRLEGVDCALFQGDIRDTGAVDLAMRGCDSVIHLAYIQGTRTFYSEPRLILDVAMRGILNVLEACDHQGVRDLMLVSSAETYQAALKGATPETVPLCVPDPLNPRYSYGGGKIISELASIAWAQKEYLDRLIIVRPHNIIGPDMGTKHVVPEFALRMNKLTAEHPEGLIDFPVQGTGSETRSFCYISDCINQFMLLLDKAAGIGIWHAGNPDERFIYEVANAVAACYGREIRVIPGALSEGSPVRRKPDTKKITSLGYPGARIPFMEAIARTVEWYKI